MQEQDNKNDTLLHSIKKAYQQYKSDLEFIKNKSNTWNGRSYRWGQTHWQVAKHWIYWYIIKQHIIKN